MTIDLQPSWYTDKIVAISELWRRGNLYGFNVMFTLYVTASQCCLAERETYLTYVLSIS